MEEVKLEIINKTLSEKKAENIEIYDVRHTSPICSYIIIATILNGRHGKAVADAISEIQERLGETVRNIEGNEKDPWVLIDLNDIIIHLFTEEERKRIDLDSLIKKVHGCGKN